MIIKDDPSSNPCFHQEIQFYSYDQFAITWKKVKVAASCSKMSKVLIEEIITIL